MWYGSGYGSRVWIGVWIACGPGALIHTVHFEPQPFERSLHRIAQPPSFESPHEEEPSDLHIQNGTHAGRLIHPGSPTQQPTKSHSHLFRRLNAHQGVFTPQKNSNWKDASQITLESTYPFLKYLQLNLGSPPRTSPSLSLFTTLCL